MSTRIRENGLIFLNRANRTFQAPRVLLQRGGAFLGRAQVRFDSPLSNLVVIFYLNVVNI
jgi:hypothetical protein